MDLHQFQNETAEWRERNFPGYTPDDQFMGMVEEIGELAHSKLKMKQGIRGTEAEHLAAERDAIGDLLVFTAGYCSARGFDLDGIVQSTWDEVKTRDWINRPQTG